MMWLKVIFFCFFFLVFIPILLFVGTLFFNPELLINSRNLEWAINKSQIFKEWSWEKHRIHIKWEKWNERRFIGNINNFCFQFTSESNEIKACLPEISWDLLIHFNLTKLPRITSISPFFAESRFIDLKFNPVVKREKTPPPDIWSYWKMFWNPVIPDLQLILNGIKFKEYDLNLTAEKFGKEFNAQVWELKLYADPKKLVARLADGYEIPKKLPLAEQLKFYRTRLIAFMDKSKIEIDLGGNYSPLSFKVISKIKLPLTKGFDDPIFIKSTLLSTKGYFQIPEIKKNLYAYAPHPYHSLPAPLNVMDGEISSEVFFSDAKNENVKMRGETNIDLKEKKQILDLFIGHEIPINLIEKEIRSIDLSIDLREIFLQLPRFSKKSIPPKFIPDSRIKQSFVLNSEKKKSAIPLQLKASNENPLKIKSNLIDEIIKLNFNLTLSDGIIQNGWIQILPLKTKVFKRPIELKNLKITFHEGKDPFLKGLFSFPLPEYKITMHLEGPSTQPRIVLESKPPLPQSDIYAVLLFGRPMSDLGPEDKSSSAQMNQILAQGILSLSVLYFLAGSPVEYIGYDPDSKKAVAQIGLGDKNSLKVEGDENTVSGVGVRRSLGKGWYIDTSVNQEKDITGNSVQDYGVLIERIISY